MKTSRQRLLDYVQNQRIVTAAEISQALKMTQANARHHLHVLRDQGLVQVIGQRPCQGKGRPASLYSPTALLAADNLGNLACALLEEIGRLPDQTIALRRIARRLAERQPEPVQRGKRRAHNLTQRLYSTVQHLNTWQYLARWEAHATAPRLILGHCPYYSILPEHPELCQLDQFLLESLLDVPVKHTGKLLEDARGLHYCVFHPVL